MVCIRTRSKNVLTQLPHAERTRNPSAALRLDIKSWIHGQMDFFFGNLLASDWGLGNHWRQRQKMADAGASQESMSFLVMLEAEGFIFISSYQLPSLTAQVKEHCRGLKWLQWNKIKTSCQAYAGRQVRVTIRYYLYIFVHMFYHQDQ